MDRQDYKDRQDYSYRIAQALMGIGRVLREQLKVVGAKAWSKMNNNEKVLLLNALRKVYIKEYKKDESTDSV